MVEELLAIFAAYGLGVGLVHLFRWRCHWGREETSHAVIVTRDAGATVEWHLRTFAFAQWLRARHTRITLIDEGSTDDTVRIAERLIARLHANWELIPAGTPAEAQRWLETLGGANEVVVIRGAAACGPAGTTI
ncbi:hypothetical protein FE782_19565 [Paenibacillus antri]|uniref:Uncharacterized protein n=1 Tax=Paenibacillus antri TaxID=2582848 RepID=A0A5R9GBR5_9BACL|nr:hypothetical protein [Paenibacillus antri]TLS50564.1 hypothetical protein FE782_19565 [Paenibacillus antri]